MDFRKMNLARLREVHSDMLATASDLDADVPDALCREFDDTRVGVKTCRELHELIQRARHSVELKKQEAEMAKKTKATKKTAAKKAATGRARSSGFPEGAKITVLVKENPCREGTGRHERVAKMLKSGGKTVAGSGVATGTLRYGVNEKLIKVG